MEESVHGISNRVLVVDNHVQILPFLSLFVRNKLDKTFTDFSIRCAGAS